MRGDSWENGEGRIELCMYIHIYTCADPFHMEGCSGSGKVLPPQSITWTATANYSSRCESRVVREGGRGWEWVCPLLCAGVAAV